MIIVDIYGTVVSDFITKVNASAHLDVAVASFAAATSQSADCTICELRDAN